MLALIERCPFVWGIGRALGFLRVPTNVRYRADLGVIRKRPKEAVNKRFLSVVFSSERAGLDRVENSDLWIHCQTVLLILIRFRGIVNTLKDTFGELSACQSRLVNFANKILCCVSASEINRCLSPFQNPRHAGHADIDPPPFPLGFSPCDRCLHFQCRSSPAPRKRFG